MDNYYKSKEFKEILEQYENLHDSEQTLLSSEDYSDIAQYYHEQADDKKALEAIHVALSLYPGSVGPTSFLARYALLEEHDVDKASNIADGITDKNDPDYVLLMAEIMIVDGRADEADSYLDEAYDFFYDDDYYDDMPLDVAVLFTDYDEVEYADKWLQRSDETDEIDYIVTKAKILAGQGKINESEELINKLINADPYSTEYWDLLAVVQSMGGKTSDSITSSDYALAIDPDDRDALLNKAKGLMSLENYSEAEKLFRKYAKLEPNKLNSYTLIAFSLMAQNRPQEALLYFEKALEICEKEPKAYQWGDMVDVIYQMAYLENTLSHFSKSRELLNRIAEIEKDNLSDNLDELGRRLAEVDCGQGCLCLEENKLDEAIDWFDQAVNDSNGDPHIYSRIAGAAYESGFVQYAYNILHELLFNIGVEEPLGMKYLALCCKHLGKEDELKCIEEKIEKNKKSQEI